MRFFKSTLLLIFAFSFFFVSTTTAQTSRKVNGTIVDTAGVAIAEANILLIAGSDTLKRVSDKEGKFEFRGIKGDKINISVSIVGYQTYVADVTISDKSTTLAAIALKTSGTFLKEVVIKGKPNPVRVMKDTLEFDAAAYNVLEDDRVSDLLKQLPGVEVDENDNVKTMGKEMVKLRVNGKDFFTNNVQEFISKLPANIVSKIQIIEDYGDQANFTGNKTGEPVKMLNIVTKPGMNKGSFGSISFNGGTNNQVGLNANANFWNDTQQVGFNSNIAQANNGAGQSKNKSASANYRDTFKNKISSGVNYQFSNNNNDNRNISFIETVNTLGTIYNNTENVGNSRNNANNLNWDLQKTGDKNFVTLSFGATFQKNDNISNYTAKQSGIVKQDLNNDNNSSGSSPNINIIGSWSRRFGKKRKSLSVNLFLTTSDRLSDQRIKSNTLYYDPTTLILAKDSLLDRFVDSRNKNISTSLSVNYTHPLKQPKDTLASRSLGLTYSFSFGNSNNTVLTYVNNFDNELNLVDSLSNLYQSQTISQNANLNYSYNNKKLSYNIGASFRPTLLIGNYENLHQKIRNSAFNYAPNFNFNRFISKTKTIAIRYLGNSTSPSSSQLQPVRNTQNLQNVIIGNPNLKPSFVHNLSINYNYVNQKTGSSFQTAINGSTTQNQIVSNVILLRDTLNSLKQETRFENTNGSYNLNGNYVVSLPFAKNKYTVNIMGSLGYNNTVSFTDNVKYFNKGIQASQMIIAGFNTKKFSANANATYNFSTNNFSLIKGNTRNIETWNFTVSSRATVLKTYKVSVNATKRINSGYVLQNVNPTLIGAAVSKVFFKSRSLSFNAQAYDLLNQGNNLSRNIVGNSVIDTQNNQITRFFTFGLSYNLQKFGGK